MRMCVPWFIYFLQIRAA